ncbi:hypothetical protein P22_3168 [Propionispora sp. 2/2-37]|uniref:alpha-L-rhamnosidase-related protein n=1 Tax=Propionispora sp. 2/2-37 TaxID=1677858 RepID=UPI0006C6439D|nr:alpha-L-rhamnosidase C-terminal domain-containing protein [Propionispora sp. 2/2-37]CUH97042.1 hypothetical protein P22_3168 [Propionispora sp. 2/2-37]
MNTAKCWMRTETTPTRLWERAESKKDVYIDVAYRLLYQTLCPSWLYEVEHGATTIWEFWDAIKADGKVGTCSFNHYAFGCVGDWMYRNILGINNGDIAYRKITIQPDFSCGLTYASGSYETVNGKVGVDWKIENGKKYVQVDIPVNTTATLKLAGKDDCEVGSGHYEFII